MVWLDKSAFNGFITAMRKRELTERQQRTIYTISLVVAATLLVAAIVFVGIPLVKFISEPVRFRQWVSEKGFWGKVAFVCMEIFKVLIVVIPGEPFEIAAGYAFGTWEGLLLCAIGITIGSLIVFSLVRRFGLSMVRVFFTQERIDTMRLFHASKRRNVNLSILYMIPGTPKDFLNYYAGLTDIRFSTWAVVSSIGRVPSIITSTVAGNALGEKHYLFGIVVTAVTFVLGLGALIVYNRVISKPNIVSPETPQSSSL